MTVSQIVVEEAKRRSFVQRNFTVSANDLNRRKVSMRALEEGKQTDEDISDASGSEELEKDPDIPVPQFDSGISPQMVFGTYQQPLALPNFDWISAAPYPPYQFLSPVWGEFPSPLQSNFPEFAGHHQDFPHAKSENSFYRQKYN